jgi:hypothetical protein
MADIGQPTALSGEQRLHCERAATAFTMAALAMKAFMTRLQPRFA